MCDCLYYWCRDYWSVAARVIEMSSKKSNDIVFGIEDYAVQMSLLLIILGAISYAVMMVLSLGKMFWIRRHLVIAEQVVIAGFGLCVTILSLVINTFASSLPTEYRIISNCMILSNIFVGILFVTTKCSEMYRTDDDGDMDDTMVDLGLRLRELKTRRERMMSELLEMTQSDNEQPRRQSVFRRTSNNPIEEFRLKPLSAGQDVVDDVVSPNATDQPSTNELPVVPVQGVTNTNNGPDSESHASGTSGIDSRNGDTKRCVSVIYYNMKPPVARKPKIQPNTNSVYTDTVRSEYENVPKDPVPASDQFKPTPVPRNTPSGSPIPSSEKNSLSSKQLAETSFIEPSTDVGSRARRAKLRLEGLSHCRSNALLREEPMTPRPYDSTNNASQPNTVEYSFPRKLERQSGVPGASGAKAKLTNSLAFKSFQFPSPPQSQDSEPESKQHDADFTCMVSPIASLATPGPQVRKSAPNKPNVSVTYIDPPTASPDQGQLDYTGMHYVPMNNQKRMTLDRRLTETMLWEKQNRMYAPVDLEPVMSEFQVVHDEMASYDRGRWHCSDSRTNSNVSLGRPSQDTSFKSSQRALAQRADRIYMPPSNQQ